MLVQGVGEADHLDDREKGLPGVALLLYERGIVDALKGGIAEGERALQLPGKVRFGLCFGEARQVRSRHTPKFRADGIVHFSSVLHPVAKCARHGSQLEAVVLVGHHVGGSRQVQSHGLIAVSHCLRQWVSRKERKGSHKEQEEQHDHEMLLRFESESTRNLMSGLDSLTGGQTRVASVYSR